MTPASSHVTGSVKHLWAKHIKPKADKRYYTKKAANNRFLTPAQADARYRPATTGFGESLSGVWSASAPAGGLGTATIEFDPPLPATVTGSYLAPGATTADCPGVGQAQPGRLCAYASWVFGMTPSSPAFWNPTSSTTGVARGGGILYLASSHAEGNARGTWTVTAPLTASRPAPDRRPARPGPEGN